MTNIPWKSATASGRVPLRYLRRERHDAGGKGSAFRAFWAEGHGIPFGHFVTVHHLVPIKWKLRPALILDQALARFSIELQNRTFHLGMPLFEDA